MSYSTKMPGRGPRQDGEASLAGHHGEGGTSIGTTEASGGISERPRDGHDDGILDTSSPAVRALLKISPLRWWRSAPAGAFRATEYLEVRSALAEVATLINAAEVEPALQGDADAAIALVLSLMPITRRGGIKTDIAMTAVLSLALRGELRCALVLAHVLDRAEPDPRRADQLCGSWFEFHLNHSASRGGVAPAETAVLEAPSAFDAPRAR
ncbi:hypothetical protein [Bradyrhizobium sp. AS23.2]|uniref:hypothetical protein n=1 Tax=Bradyrhizobium sp. AS23.2 TaxID=1680155 RepID=UPI00093AB8FC|nr:hypothetical protein [Bradyrhizobium sp. AS23.2]OKO79825.1 hypothetical protein AC630_16805 [Bradyrhizobium sp. AS23.2]